MEGWLAAVVRALDREQDRWFLWVPVMLGCGIAAYLHLPREPLVAVTGSLLAMSLLLRVAGGGGTLAALTTAAVLAASLGFAFAQARTHLVSAPVLPSGIRPLQVTGWVELAEPRQGRGQRIILRVHAIDGLRQDQLPRRVRISTRGADLALHAGDGVAVTARLSPPSAPAEPGAYDPRRLAYFQGIGGFGFATAPLQRVEIGVGAPADVRLRATFNRLRERIGARITSVLPGETGSIAVALITGERGGITEATNSAYRDSGLIHVLSISGLHMTIMAGAMFFVVRLLLSLVPPIALRFNIKKWAAVAGGAGALGYLLISGAALPTIRSFVMIVFMFLAILMDRPALALRNVALAALVILAFQPESVVDVSFQMSFAAVVALIAGYEAWRDSRARVGEAAPPVPLAYPLAFLAGIVASTLIASAAVAPFGIYHFHQSQQYAVLANLIAIPICNIVIMPAALAVLVAMPAGLDAWPLALMGIGIDAMTWCAYAVAALPGAVIRIAAIPTAAFALLVLGGLWLLLWRTTLRLAGLIAILAGIALAPFGTRPDVLIAEDGRLVAVRGADGRRTAAPGGGNAYTLARWVERDGDTPAASGRGTGATQSASPFACDGWGCIVWVKGRLVALSRQPAALADDCRAADVLVIQGARLPHCKAGAAVIGSDTLREHGAHAISFSSAGMVVETVRRPGDERPWTRPTPPGEDAKPRTRTPTRRAPSRPIVATERAQPLEIGDDNADDTDPP